MLPYGLAHDSSLYDDALASPIPMMLTGSDLTAFLIVVCFSAGLNVYATVAMLGLLARTEVLVLPPGLHALTNLAVIGFSSFLFLLEFVGDKIPVFDLLWNALHTFVRIPVAALLTYGATAQLPEWERLLATLLGALIALVAHGGKIAARVAVAHSPEPFSNIGLSLSEDAAVAFLLWYATRHPFSAAAVVGSVIVAIAVMLRAVLSASGNLFRDAASAVRGKEDVGSPR